ncbi:MAG: SIMPL domain-containing protein [Acidobacteria bacterium]|nr:SIMPL domain-containing protein [Acidobacteriota bacterium]
MKRILILMLLTVTCAGGAWAQASGNIGYAQGGGNARAQQNEKSKRTQGQGEAPPSATTMFLEASVLMNVKADEYVAVFGVAQECTTVPECNEKMDATINQFSTDLKGLGIGRENLYVDFAAQNKIYAYQVTSSIAKENLVGFELKKNVAVHYQDRDLLDKLIITASKAKIFDLIKVDYIVKDTNPVQSRLMDEAARIIKQKAARYEKLLDIKLLPPAQLYAEKPSIYYPTEMYDSYTAYESEEVSSDYYREKYTVQNARKSRTFFFNPLNADGFDTVINPVVIEPVVQFTLYLKVKYEIEQPKK